MAVALRNRNNAADGRFGRALRGLQAFALAALPGLARQPVFLQPDALPAQMPESQKVSALIQRFPKYNKGLYNKGFSLIEVMIVAAIVAIIAAIAMPSYQAQVTRTRCSDGVAFISRVMQNQERSFTNNLTYTTDLTTLGYASPATSPDGFYQVTAAACAGAVIANCVLLTATGQGAQAGGAATAATGTGITLNSRGQLVAGGACN